MDKMFIYNKLPVFAQNVACYYEGRKIKKNRYGKTFWDLLSNYESRNNWTYEQLCTYRDNRLANMIKHCYNTVPYYKRLFDNLGILYQDIKTIEDLKYLPVLTKQTVKENFKDFISTAIPANRMIISHTSGTTGSGFKFYTTKEAICEQWAVWWRYRRNLGIEFDTWCALFGGRSVVPVERSKPPYFRINAPCRQIYFSTYHMSEENLKWYVVELNARKLKWIHGYPSAISLLADYIICNKLKLSYQVEYITTGAENLMPLQVDKIQKAFNVIPYQHYGLSEGTANFSQNKDREIYVDEDFAVVEFINQSNDECCEIIGTSLSNFAMPLLRYKTGDIATVKNTARGRLITNLDGRSEDYVVLPNGARIGRLDHIFKDMVNIKEAQIIQKKIDEVVLKIIKNPEYSETDEKMLYKETIQRLNGINIKIEYVNHIPRSNTGKLKFVVSELTK